jgi:hypothetical protein
MVRESAGTKESVYNYEYQCIQIDSPRYQSSHPENKKHWCLYGIVLGYKCWWMKEEVLCVMYEIEIEHDKLIEQFVVWSIMN